jgi:hypothetical protein
MTKVSILTNGLGTFKSRAFLLPIIRFRDELEAAGINCYINHQLSEVSQNSDIIILEDDAISRSNNDPISAISGLKNQINRVLWFDTTDGTGTINGDILPFVDGYYKKQLLSERSQYCEPLQRTRLYTDYYYENYDIPPNVDNEPQIESKSQLDKLGVFWNLGYEVYLPLVSNKLKNGFFRYSPEAISKRIPWKWLLSVPGVWASVDRDREVNISGRFSTKHDDAAIKLHRELFLEELGGKVNSGHLSSVSYWQELRNSKILLSPFGWGEICHRDFEGFMSGSLLIKPCMNHLETWPPLYEDGETILTVDWDMNDLEQTIRWALNHDRNRRSIAKQGQARYHRYLMGDSAADQFINRFKTIIS